MKSVGTTYWLSPNIGATNESGFSALPGGYRTNNGQFYLALQAMHAFFWSKSETITSSRVHYRGLYNTSEAVDIGVSALINGFKIEGASIRCLRD
jgi:uncharacterized protein (TIGR02145 family)